MTEYKYWQPVILEEHRLFSSEIAEMWGVYSTTDRLHTKMVHAILSEEEYLARKNPLFYQTKNGLVRCFSDDIIRKGLTRLLTFTTDSGKHYTYENHGHNFKYKRKAGAPDWDIG